MALNLRSKRFLTGLITGSIGVSLLSLIALAKGPEITVYNQNFGLVKDYRTLSITKGISEVALDDVAALIDPTSVHFKSLTAPKGVDVLEQNFRYDLINRKNILNRMVGHQIRFTKEGTEYSGILLNPATTYVRNSGYNVRPYNNSVRQSNNDAFAVQTASGIMITTLDDVIIDKLPEGLYPRPTLAWTLDSTKGGNHETEISYLSDGLNWYTDYVAVLNEANSTLDLTGWVTLDNHSGASYKDAKLKLVAGDVRKLKQPRHEMAYAMADMAVRKSAAPQFKEEGLFEYHLYSLQRPTNVNNNETKQVTLLSSMNVPVTKKYIYDPDQHSPLRWYNNMRPGQGRATSRNTKVSTLVSFKNKKSNNLGMPLPKGRIRVNLKDSSGSLQFVGEDKIDHTPENEVIELYLGDAFDIVGNKKRTSYEQNHSYYQETYQVSVRNHKAIPITAHVIDHVYGDWEMRNTTTKFTEIDSNTLDMAVAVPAKGSKTITYTIRVNRR